MNTTSKPHSSLHTNRLAELLQTQATSDRLSELPLEQLVEDPMQDRRTWTDPRTQAHLTGIVESVAAIGVRRPIEVFKTAPDRYQIIAGQVRYEAAKRNNLKTIPALIRLNPDERQRSIDMLGENVSRAALAPMDLHYAIKERLANGFSREELCTALGKDKTWISRIIALGRLPKDVKDFADSGQIRDPGTLLNLAKLPAEERATALPAITEGATTASDVLKNAAHAKPPRTPPPPTVRLPYPVVRALLQRLNPDQLPTDSDVGLLERWTAFLETLELDTDA